ncbi:hypothetical protein Q4577_06555 [Marinovum sp. 2_MG-2023]|uniref:hypothetical protein n=1 Tax=Roseobacteraceae TaxID=2854170 RepID=UPI001FCFEA26|nr:MULTISPECIES: hypothetical protein [Roseobacteraceae]MCJ7871107.1 hypothetical protein [Phaeobacter sp. J2-8]MDO6729670.1 hypothetical protein [Marinovum sp. 2_MG-2023]MDO6779484.1 hypothetical protein [Marinovum sp. 1_MG-2023]
MSKLSLIYVGLCAAVLTAAFTVQSVQGGMTPSRTGFSDDGLWRLIESSKPGIR